MVTTSALHLLIDARAAQAGAAQFQRATGQITASAATASKATSSLVASMKPLVALVGIAATVKTLADFEEKMTLVGRVANVTGKALEVMTAKARQLGATTRFTGAEAAEGMLELSRAGFSATESMLAIADSLDLATAGGLELGEATGFMSNSIRQFSLDAAEAAMVASTFTSISNNANTDIRQLAEALKLSGTVAAALGIDLATASAAIGVLGDRGVQGSMAGTQLRGVLLGLASPTDKAASALAKMGLSLEDVNPATTEFTDIAIKLKSGIDSLTNPLEAAGIFADIFGRRQAAAALATAEANVKMQENIDLANGTITAHSDLANAMEQTIIGKFKALVSAIQEVMLDTGDRGLTGALNLMMDTMTDTFRMLGGVEGAFLKAGIAAKTLATALLFVSVRLVALKLVTAASAVWGFVSAAWAAVAGVGSLNGALVVLEITLKRNPLFLVASAVAAIGTAMFFVKGHADDDAAALRNLKEAQDDLQDSAIRAEASMMKLAIGMQRGERSMQIEGLHERIKQLTELKVALAGIKEFPASYQGKGVLGSLLETALQRRPTSVQGRDTFGGVEPFTFEKGLGGARDLYPYADSVAAVNEALKESQQQLEKLDPVLAAQKLLNDAAGESLDEWSLKMDASNKVLQKMGATAAETALEQEVLATQMKIQADSTRILGTEEIQQIRDKIVTRNEAEAATKAQANAEKSLAAASKAAMDSFFTGWKKATDAARAARETNERYAQSIMDNVAVLRLRRAGDEAGATQLQITNTLTRRGIDLNSKLGESLRVLMTEQAGFNTAQGDGTVKLNESAQAAQRYILEASRQGEELKTLIPLQGQWSEAYDLSTKKARINAEATALVKDATKEQAIAILEARDAMLADADKMQQLDRQLELTQGAQAAFGDMFIGIIDGSQTAAEAFESFGRRVMAMIMDMIVRKALMDALFGAGTGLLADAAAGGTGVSVGTGGAGGGGVQFARGGFVSGGNFKRYAKGSVINRPTMLQSDSGSAMMREAGQDEAIMPLRRDSRGNLGVAVAGNGGSKVNNITMVVNTKDADSFRRSRIQIQDDLKRMTTQLE